MNDWYYYWITTINNIGHVKRAKLLETFASPMEAYKADGKEYTRLSYLSKEDVESIIESKNPSRITSEINHIKSQNINIISIESEKYPELLSYIQHPPYIIYQKGNMDLTKPCIAIVGSRKCSEYGHTMAYEIARELARMGVTVVSGVAKGIDAAAHEGALVGGKTIGVLGNGPDRYYPASNAKLQKQIESQGCILSEYPVNTKPHPSFFPARNRIISGLSRGVLIVEAAEKSGSLITANFALEQGRDVFAVPGNAWSKMSIGSNKIIQSGGKLVLNAYDIIEEIQQYLPAELLGDCQNKDNLKVNKLAQDEIMVYDNLSQEPLYIDEVNNNIKLPIATLQYIITSLELKGLIKRLPGQRLVRTE